MAPLTLQEHANILRVLVACCPHCYHVWPAANPVVFGPISCTNCKCAKRYCTVCMQKFKDSSEDEEHKFMHFGEAALERQKIRGQSYIRLRKLQTIGLYLLNVETSAEREEIMDWLGLDFCVKHDIDPSELSDPAFLDRQHAASEGVGAEASLVPFQLHVEATPLLEVIYNLPQDIANGGVEFPANTAEAPAAGAEPDLPNPPAAPAAAAAAPEPAPAAQPDPPAAGPGPADPAPTVTIAVAVAALNKEIPKAVRQAVNKDIPKAVRKAVRKIRW